MSLSPNFNVFHKDASTSARTGVLQLKNGQVRTPSFMPVGTHGTVRGLACHELESTGAEITLRNTYHLYVRPGIETIEKLGGLHAFTGWRGPILTDSGGFQIFSLSDARKLSDQSVIFKNPLNGDLIELSPERVVDVQERFGSDVMMALDECPPGDANPGEIAEAIRRTTLWAGRSREAWQRKDLALFPIFQGGCDLNLRAQSLKEILGLEAHHDAWPGIAIGGLSVGEKKSDFVRTIYGLRSSLPTDRPRYLMGVGTPKDIVLAVACGVDMFDCVLPSRNGRHGIVMTSQGRLNLLNAEFTHDPRPIDETMDPPEIQKYSRAFLRHLFMAGDALAGRIATWHNVIYFIRLMETIRKEIENGSFSGFAREFLSDPRNEFLGSEKGYREYPSELVA